MPAAWRTAAARRARRGAATASPRTWKSPRRGPIEIALQRPRLIASRNRNVPAGRGRRPSPGSPIASSADRSRTTSQPRRQGDAFSPVPHPTSRTRVPATPRSPYGQATRRLGTPDCQMWGPPSASGVPARTSGAGQLDVLGPGCLAARRRRRHARDDGRVRSRRGRPDRGELRLRELARSDRRQEEDAEERVPSTAERPPIATHGGSVPAPAGGFQPRGRCFRLSGAPRSTSGR